MAKSSTGRGKHSKGTRHNNRHNSKRTRSRDQRAARRITRNNCVRKRGLLARSRLLNKKTNKQQLLLNE